MANYGCNFPSDLLNANNACRPYDKCKGKQNKRYQLSHHEYYASFIQLFDIATNRPLNAWLVKLVDKYERSKEIFAQ